MAKFQPILGNIAGSIGANTFSRNRGGAYIRRRSAPTNPNSTHQQAVRAYLSTLAKEWQFLTNEQRDAWHTWAQSRNKTDTLGNETNYTGHQMFISTNLRRLQMGLPPQTTPPTEDTPPSLQSLTIQEINKTSNSVKFAFTPTTLEPNLRLQAWQCKPSSGNRNPNFKQAYLIGYSGPGPTSPQSFPLRFPVQDNESVVFYVAVVSETGLQSPPLRVKIDKAQTVQGTDGPS